MITGMYNYILSLRTIHSRLNVLFRTDAVSDRRCFGQTLFRTDKALIRDMSYGHQLNL